MRLLPLLDRLVIKEIEEDENISEGGLLLISDKKGYGVGKVLSKGPGYKHSNGMFSSLSVEEGNTVYFIKDAGVEVIVGGEKQRVLRQEDVLGKLIEDKES